MYYLLDIINAIYCKTIFLENIIDFEEKYKRKFIELF